MLDTVYEYKFLAGMPKKLEELETQVNALATQGWEVIDTTTGSAGGFGFGLAFGSGLGGGGSMSSFVVTMRREKMLPE